jgi:hypothetical protein
MLTTPLLTYSLARVRLSSLLITYFDSIKLKTTVVLKNKDDLKDWMVRLIGDITLMQGS